MLETAWESRWLPEYLKNIDICESRVKPHPQVSCIYIGTECVPTHYSESKSCCYINNFYYYVVLFRTDLEPEEWVKIYGWSENSSNWIFWWLINLSRKMYLENFIQISQMIYIEYSDITIKTSEKCNKQPYYTGRYKAKPRNGAAQAARKPE